jgi:Concanavalin A-like lectin/glucanases superfamily
MPDDFDPYHVWLGIPPDEQPANRYRLLGIRAFESNPDVIDNAADRQTVHLRTFQGGKHGLLTQRLLNEVASARVCLLNPQSKAAYDQQLRAALAAVTPQSPVASPFAPATARGPGGSQIGRSQPANLPVARPIETPVSQAAPPPQAGSNWDDLIGAHETGPHKPTGKSAKSAARRQASNRLVYAGVGGALIVAAGIAAVLYAINANADAALTFDWPDADRAGTTLAINGEPVQVPASGPWEFHCPPGEHRIIAQRPAFKLDQQVAVSAGDRHPVAPDWKAKAVLLLNWPLAERSGAALTVDGRPTVVSARNPLELPVEPGSHVIRVARSGAEPLEATASVASDSRKSVSLQASKPATLVIDWPAEERENAKLIIDNKEQPLDAPQLEFPLNPGRHTVRLIREGFESVNQIVDVGAAGLKPITPIWVNKDATASSRGAAPTEPTPPTDVPEPPGVAADNVAKKRLPVPSDAEQQRITKQLDEAYKTEPLPEKQRALAEQFFTLADQPGTSPDERFMVLMKAVGLAAKVWDLNSALHGIDLLDAAYEVDSFEIKQRLIDDAVRLAASPEHAAAVLTAAEQIIEQAVAEERYDNALAMADAANKALNKLPAESRARKDAADRLTRRRREIVVLQTASATAVDAQTALDKMPDDPEANSNLGRWYCFYKGDWDRGLPLLAKGKEGSLKSLAQQELAVNLELKPQLELADGWWDVAQKETGLPRDLVRLHAGEIYQLMLPNLQSGVKTTAVEKRLAEIQPIVEQRLSQNAARRGAWDQFDLTQAKLEDGFVRLTKDENLIITKNDYSGPLDISLIARTAANNIRVYGPRGSSVIFNWETNPAELRVNRPDGNDGPETGSLATITVQPLSPHRWYPLRWRIASDGMEIWIAGKAVFAEKRSYDLSAKARVAVRAVDSNVDLKSLVVTPVTTKSGLGNSGTEMRRPSPNAHLPTGPVLLFTFDKNTFFQRDGQQYVRDLSGNGNHGLVKGTKPVEGRVGDALSFNGDGDGIECASSESLNPASALTVCAWIKMRAARPFASIVSKDDWQNDGARGFVLRTIDDSKLNFTIGRNGWPGATSSARIDLENWHHVAATYDGKTSVTFLDGVVAGSSETGGPISPSPYNLKIGQDAFANDRGFEGAIDEVAVFARTLTEEEIQRIYQMGLQGKSLSALPTRGDTKKAIGVKSEVDSPSGSSGKKKQIDLLKLVDINRDGVNGNWHRNAEEIWCDAAEGARLAFPYLPPKEYDFEVVFTRVSGHDYVGQLCVGGGHQFLWGMSGHRRGKVSAFELLDGQDGRSNPTHKEFSIANGQRYTSIVKVRRDQVEAWVNGNIIDAWTTDYHDLEVPAAWVLPDPRRLGIGAWNSLLTVHSAKVTEITGTGKVLFQPIPDSAAKPPPAVKSAAGSLSAFPRGQWVDLLRLVDSMADAVRGTWSREREEISCTPGDLSRVKLPVIINGGYDLEVEFTRTEGNTDVCIVLPVGGNECLIMLSAANGAVSGLEYVDGRSVGDQQNPYAVRPGTLENGRRYRMLASVRLAKDGMASADVSLNGKPYLPHWQGKPSSLSLYAGWILPNTGQPGLGAWKSAVTYHSARLRMISGEAISESELKKPSLGPKIMKARWGGGKNWADVTVQVRRAVGQGNTVRAKSDFVGADPTPGWRKHLEITYERDGQQKSVSIDEDCEWTRQEYESL